MCDFGITEVAIAGVVIAAASAAAQAKAAADQAAAQKTANNIQTANIIAARQDKDTQAQDRMVVANDQAAQQLQQNKMAERSGLATAATSAGENGVAGNSVDALANEYANKSDQYTQDVEYNRKAQENELDFAMKGFNSDSESQINSLKQPVYPNLVASGLQVAGAGVSAYSTASYQEKMLAKGGGTQ